MRPGWTVTLSHLFFHPSLNLGYAAQGVHSTNLVLHRTELTNEMKCDKGNVPRPETPPVT